jgi:mRNA interferase MazF
MATSRSWVPDRGDVIWIDFSPQAGTEMKDEHPMLVLSTKPFNERTSIVIGLPMTHATANETNPFAVKHVGAKGEVAYILTHQPRSFDWRRRPSRPHPWKKLPATVLEESCGGLNSIIALCG